MHDILSKAEQAPRKKQIVAIAQACWHSLSRCHRREMPGFESRLLASTMPSLPSSLDMCDGGDDDSFGEADLDVQPHGALAGDSRDV
jgi:hypothetical protein